MTERILFHSVFLQCPSCNVWGTPFPNDTECGNCGNSDGTVTYVSQEDSNAQAAEKVREALENLERLNSASFYDDTEDGKTRRMGFKDCQLQIKAIREELLTNDLQ